MNQDLQHFFGLFYLPRYSDVFDFSNLNDSYMFSGWSKFELFDDSSIYSSLCLFPIFIPVIYLNKFLTKKLYIIVLRVNDPQIDLPVNYPGQFIEHLLYIFPWLGRALYKQ